MRLIENGAWRDLPQAVYPNSHPYRNSGAHRFDHAFYNATNQQGERINTATKTTIEPQIGDLFVNIWGTTMQRVVFYQVLSKEKGKNRYTLTRPLVEASGNVCIGEVKLLGKSESIVPVAYAKMHRGRFVLCNNDFTIKGYCNELDPAQPGDSYAEWSD